MTGLPRHGGDLDAMKRMFPNAVMPWVDLSTGINPWPWPSSAIPPEHITRLPSQRAFEDLINAMAVAFNASSDYVLPTPGSELAIHLLPTVISPKRVAVLSPTYGDHARVWRAAKCKVIETDDPLSFSGQVDAVVLCNPNNPDGRLFNRSDLEACREHLALRGGVLIIDEAYADLQPSLSMAEHAGKDGLIILRSMGKFFGLAGLRAGAVLGPEDLIKNLRSRLGVWSLSGPALALGVAAYTDVDWQDTTRRQLRQARMALGDLLTDAACDIVGGTDLFAFVRVRSAMGTWTKLARAGISVRRFDWSESCLRIGLPASDLEQQRLAAALKP